VIEAPFSGAEAARTLVSLSAVFLAIGGLLVIARANRKAVSRAVGLGVLIAVFASFSRVLFQ